MSCYGVDVLFGGYLLPLNDGLTDSFMGVAGCILMRYSYACEMFCSVFHAGRMVYPLRPGLFV
jgi:hypothetical protein